MRRVFLKTDVRSSSTFDDMRTEVGEKMGLDPAEYAIELYINVNGGELELDGDDTPSDHIYIKNEHRIFVRKMKQVWGSGKDATFKVNKVSKDGGIWNEGLRKVGK